MGGKGGGGEEVGRQGGGGEVVGKGGVDGRGDWQTVRTCESSN